MNKNMNRQILFQRLKTSKSGNKKAKKSLLRKQLTEIVLGIQIGFNHLNGLKVQWKIGRLTLMLGLRD